MSKINFDHVEKCIDVSFNKLFIDKIIRMTEEDQEKEKLFDKKSKNNKFMGSILRSLKSDLDALSKKSDKLWETLGMSKEEITRFIQNPGKLTKEDRETIQTLLEKIQQFKKDMGESLEKEINEDLIKSEQKRHESKRINVNKKWKAV